MITVAPDNIQWQTHWANLF